MKAGKASDEYSRVSAGRRWAGRVITGLVAAFAVLDGSVKLVPIEPVIEAQQALGFSDSMLVARGIGVLLLVCLAFHLVPRFAVLGAVLMTGFLGATMAIHLRAGNPLFTHILFGFYVAVLMWTGLVLRRPSVLRLLLSRD